VTSAPSDPAAAIVSALRPGERVYLPGSTGESSALTEALCSEGPPALDITSTFVPGINPFPGDRLPRGTVWQTPFAAAPRGSQESGRLAHLPMSYGSFARHIARSEFDTAILHVAPPDKAGRASLGTAVEFSKLAAARARRMIAIVNPRIPKIAGAETIDIRSAAMIVEIPGELRQYEVGAPSAEALAIARNTAAFIDDGAALQIGLGKAPDALMALLADRRNLRLHSGMLSDGARALAERGALANDWTHASCVHVGSGDYYDWLADRTDFSVRGVDHTHAPAVLANISGLVAVNSALSVDLFGQANLDTLDGRAVSGVGGASDFARAAALSPTGISIIGLPAVAGKAGQSRIVAQLEGPCSIPRHDVDVVVTEFGAADLRGLSVMERAERIVEIAAPQHRAALADAWREIARKL
jgi:acyl-CoA hydrolase